VISHIDSLFQLVDFLGVFVGAISGGLMAVRDTRYKYDVVGVVGLAFATALGGGIARDIILQKGPPLAFVDVRYLVLALSGAFVAMIFAGRMRGRAERVMVLIDAAALGLFAVAGTTRALNAGLRPLPALLLGGVTAVGGGCLRDVLSGRTPRIFEGGQLYAIAAVLGSAAFLLSDRLGDTREVSTIIGTLCGFGVRSLAVMYDWQTRPVRSQD